MLPMSVEFDKDLTRAMIFLQDTSVLSILFIGWKQQTGNKYLALA